MGTEATKGLDAGVQSVETVRALAGQAGNPRLRILPIESYHFLANRDVQLMARQFKKDI